MRTFRLLLAAFSVGIIVYTGIVISRHGWNLLPIFFGDMAALTWPGQFNLDFTCFLALSALWLAWRNQFSAGGIALGVLGFFGGIMVLAPYLLYASFEAGGDAQRLFLGRNRGDGHTHCCVDSGAARRPAPSEPGR